MSALLAMESNLGSKNSHWCALKILSFSVERQYRLSHPWREEHQLLKMRLVATPILGCNLRHYKSARPPRPFSCFLVTRNEKTILGASFFMLPSLPRQLGQAGQPISFYLPGSAQPAQPAQSAQILELGRPGCPGHVTKKCISLGKLKTLGKLGKLGNIKIR